MQFVCTKRFYAEPILFTSPTQKWIKFPLFLLFFETSLLSILIYHFRVEKTEPKTEAKSEESDTKDEVKKEEVVDSETKKDPSDNIQTENMEIVDDKE